MVFNVNHDPFSSEAQMMSTEHTTWKTCQPLVPTNKQLRPGSKQITEEISWKCLAAAVVTLLQHNTSVTPNKTERQCSAQKEIFGPVWKCLQRARICCLCWYLQTEKHSGGLRCRYSDIFSFQMNSAEIVCGRRIHVVLCRLCADSFPDGRCADEQTQEH